MSVPARKTRFKWLVDALALGGKPPATEADRTGIASLKEIVQDSNLNFLFGAGTSASLCAALGPIEELLTDLDRNATGQADDIVKFAKASVYASYLRESLAPNMEIAEQSPRAVALIDDYEHFLRTIHSLLISRGDSLLDKQVNIFSTNVDIAVEVAAEAAGVNLNDGFAGRFVPRFAGSNFNQLRYRRSAFRDRLSEMPVFNLIKVHGSLAWRRESPAAGEGFLGLDADLQLLNSASLELEKLGGILPALDAGATTQRVLQSAIDADRGGVGLDDFMSAYEQIQMINPTKAKFHDTVFEQVYYELIRSFSNELEKLNTVLFAVGFSFRDEHLREIVQKAAALNPTLQVFVFAYACDEADDLRSRLQADTAVNRNIKVVQPLDCGDADAALSLRRVTSQFFEGISPTSLAADKA